MFLLYVGSVNQFLVRCKQVVFANTTNLQLIKNWLTETRTFRTVYLNRALSLDTQCHQIIYTHVVAKCSNSTYWIKI